MNKNDINNNSFIPALQFRWQVNIGADGSRLLYFGLRNPPLHRRQALPVSEASANIIKQFDGVNNLSYYLSQSMGDQEHILNEIMDLINQNIIVQVDKVKIQAEQTNYQQCVKCINNDYILPGIEFDQNGVCAFCQCYEKEKDTEENFFIGGNTITEEELIELKKTNTSAFDVLVLYTGGKDSSYLLWYLSEKIGLNVLACTWDMPFTNDESWENIKAAQKKLPNVEWVVRTIRPEKMEVALRALVKKFGLPCICPWAAYGLFYPLAVQEKIPVIMDGIESSQTHISQIFNFSSKKTGCERQTCAKQQTMDFLKSMTKANSGKNLTFVEAFCEMQREYLSESFGPLKAIIDHSENHQLPEIKRLQSENIYTSWKDVASVIKKELNWKMPKNQTGLLHTSCKIEKAKDYIQFNNYSKMNTQMFPQSILEISSAIHFGHITREDGIRELSERGYFSVPDEIKYVKNLINLSKTDMDEMEESLRTIYS